MFSSVADYSNHIHISLQLDSLSSSSGPVLGFDVLRDELIILILAQRFGHEVCGVVGSQHLREADDLVQPLLLQPQYPDINVAYVSDTLYFDDSECCVGVS